MPPDVARETATGSHPVAVTEQVTTTLAHLEAYSPPDSCTGYRVQWRRAGWSKNTHGSSRMFETERAMRRFVAKLLDDGRPDLSPLVQLVVDRREVGDWVSHFEVIL